MAIRLISGAIGAGKTYYAVKHCLDNYASWDDENDKWALKDNVVIYSNIDGLLIGNDLMTEISKAGGINPFFTVDYQNEFANGKRVIYIIDEAQGPMFFHRKFYDAKVFYFFQYSRHLGIDIYLIVQDVDSLAREIRCLPEYNISAVRRTLSMGKEFRYKFMAGDDVFKTKIIARSPKVFSAYRSMMAEETEKSSSAPRRFLLMLGGASVLALLVFFFLFIPAFTGGGDNVASAQGLKPKIKTTESFPVTPFKNHTASSINNVVHVTESNIKKQTKSYEFSGVVVMPSDTIVLLNDNIWYLSKLDGLYGHDIKVISQRLVVDNIIYDVGSIIEL